MSTIGVVAIVLAGLWLAALTVVVVLVVRQVALIMVRLERSTAASGDVNIAEPTYDYDPTTDGLAVGSRVPDDVAQELPELGSGTTQLLLLSAHCNPCREMAVQLGRRPVGAFGRVVALVPGTPALADGVVDALPAGIRPIRDPVATGIAKSLEIRRVPFALRVEGGVIAAKAPPLDSVVDLERFIVDGSDSPGGRVAVGARGEGEAGHAD
ncbi:MAG: hypothetical protein AVDCRST_MAG49-2767 [uncultured Thermomicrobiales bacterium]|uniref:Thioredoxin domain-containing protein n=1 Tax=uncultured Thermomicrobiales bacterium TaxID=1645740 RepID=A0A6J4UZK2_9BACT|nr:MAG: hypothetical protein AVDCRST_MAG49-2767 [uncultured Thermomicrobiales bacterium]